MSVLLALLLGAFWVGEALELPHLAFLASEPVEVFSSNPDPPQLFWSGDPFSATWEKFSLRQGFVFRTLLPPDLLGVWTVCDPGGCLSFVRFPSEKGLLEVQGIPTTTLRVGNQQRVTDRQGQAFFLLDPGTYELVAEVQGMQSTWTVEVQQGRRRTVTAAYVQAEPSSPVVLPGSAFSVTVRIVPPLELTSLRAEISVPEGWEVVWPPEFHDPLPGGVRSERSWLVAVPEGSALGTCTLGVKTVDVPWTKTFTVTVARVLPPRTVVGHWDVGANSLDLAQPFKLTFARLLWAQSFVGRVLPYTGRTFTRKDFEELAREWEREP